MSTPQQLLFDQSDLDTAPAASVPFRPIHYLGSKLRVVEGICDLIGQAGTPNSPTCDLFAGSGTISLALSRNHPVIAVDIQEYSRVICSALLTDCQPTSAESDLVIKRLKQAPLREMLTWALEPLLLLEDQHTKEAAAGHPAGLFDIIEHGSIVSEQLGRSTAEHAELADALRKAVNRLERRGLAEASDSTVCRYFGGVYYSYRQAIELDCILGTVHASEARSRNRFLAAALATASDVVNTVGRQFAQPIRPRSANGDPKRHLIQKTLKDRTLDVHSVFASWVHRYHELAKPLRPCSVIRGDFREALASPDVDVEVVYADPPYTRDHYSRYYHALETMCLRDNPAISTATIGGKTMLSRGLYREERHQSPFCIKSQARAAFDALCQAVARKGAALVLSYSPFDNDRGERPRVTSLDVIVDIARNYFRSVDICSPGQIAHSKLTTTEMTVNTLSEAETVFVCRRPKV